jgi:prevent-host-death family protein
MWTFNADNAQGDFKEAIARAEAGEDVMIVRNGKAVAKVVADAPMRDPQKIREAFREIDRLSQGLSLGGLHIKDLINEGRRY